MSDVGVGFDIDHTLVIDNKLERVAFLHLLERIIARGGKPLGSLQAETDHIDALLTFQRGAGCTIDEAVRRFVAERGVTAADHFEEDFRRWALSMVDDFVVADPDARPTIEALEEAGVRLSVLSNGWNPLQISKARRAGYNGNVIASGDIGVQKPNPKAFAALVSDLGLPPERCFFVGDTPESDIEGALAFGLRAVWLDHEGKKYPHGAPQPTHVIHSLRELPALVELVTK